MEREQSNGRPAAQATADSMVTLPIPGLTGVWLAYDPARADPSPPVIEAATGLLARWLARRSVSLDPKQVRTALRHLHVPHLLGDSELAHALLAEIPTGRVRGEALQALLIDAIDQLDPGPAARLIERRAHLILRQLYIDRQHRLRISQELGLSERQYQRELQEALECLGSILTGKL